MERARVNGVELEYDVRGSGEPVVFIHGGLLADENAPLLDQPALTDQYRAINYHRRGFAGSEHPAGKAQIVDQAADCIALLDHLGVTKAHVVGHSLGGSIGIQVALSAPDQVHSLTLMEPALMPAIIKTRLDDEQAAASEADFAEGMRKVHDIYRSGDVRGALTEFLETRAGDAFREVLDWLTETGEFEQAIKDADTFLHVEIPSAVAWQFTPKDAARLKQPVLSVLGAHSPSRAQLVHEILTQWVPQTKKLVLPNAEHALPLMDPPGIAEALVGWFAQVPIPVRS